MKGRKVPDQRPRLDYPKRAALPACDLTLRDGRTLYYVGLGAHTPAGPRVTIQIAFWRGDDGMTVSASMDRTPHGRLLHVALSYPNRYPTWDDIKAVRAAFYPTNVDVAMMLPQERDYVNLHEYCFQMWQTPVEWGLR